MHWLIASSTRSLFTTGIYNGLDNHNGSVNINSLAQLPIIIANVIQMLLTLIAALAVLFIVYAGIQYIISEGDPTKTANAKIAITNSVVGLLLSASAYLIIDFVASRF